MLEALISLRQNGETDLKKRGDVLLVKLAGSPWGGEERRVHQVVEWEDDELERQLKEQKAAGEPHPVIVHPYAVFEDQQVLDDQGSPLTDPRTGAPLTRRVMTNRSTQGIDIDALSDAVRTRVVDPAKDSPRLSTSQYTRR